MIISTSNEQVKVTIKNFRKTKQKEIKIQENLKHSTYSNTKISQTAASKKDLQLQFRGITIYVSLENDKILWR